MVLKRLHTVIYFMGGKWNQQIILECKYCKNQFKVVPSLKHKRKHCSRKCADKSRSIELRGEKSTNWRGGRKRHKHAYDMILQENGYYIYEHRYIVEQHLGRKLKSTEIVHHINKNKKDNRLINLQLFSSQKEHVEQHIKNGDYF